jgi:hypothetical protein
VNKIALNLLSAFATTIVGSLFIIVGNYKTTVEEVASPYTTETVISVVGLPPRLSLTSNVLGFVIFVGGTGFFGCGVLKELDPLLKKVASSQMPVPIDGFLEVPLPNTNRARTETAPQVGDVRSDVPRVASRVSRPSATPDISERPPAIYREQPTPEIEPIRYPQPNADLEPTVVPEKTTIIDAAAETDLHLLFATKSGAGKTTTLLLLIYKINIFREGKALFFLVDPKKRNWMGLENIKNTYHTTDDRIVTTPAVVYPSGGNLQSAIDQITAIYDLLENRISKGQGVSFDHVYLIIDEWFALHGAIQRADSRLYKEVMQMLEWIVSMGREFAVHVVLVAQSHLVKDIGFSSTLRECFAVLCQGREGEKHDVGYTPITKAINDPWLIPSQEVADELRRQLKTEIRKAAEQNDRPVIMSTMGDPSIGLVENCPSIRSLVIFEPAVKSDVQANDIPADEVDQDALTLTKKFYDFTKPKDDGAE